MSDEAHSLLPQQVGVVASDVGDVDLPLNTAGELLAVAREKKSWTVQYVADQLKLSVRQIISLENSQFENLPKPVIVRGFVRSYAKLLKIEAEPILALLPKDVAEFSEIASLRPTLTTPFLESRLPMLGRQESNSGYIWGAVVIVGLIIGFFAIQQFDQFTSLSNFFGTKTVEGAMKSTAIVEKITQPINTAAQTEPITENAQQVVVDKVFPVAPISTEAVVPAIDPGASTSAVTSVVSPTTANTVPPSLPLSEVAPTIPALKNALHLKFKQDSWIQIKHENGLVVTSHLAKAGTEEFFEMSEPLEIRIGNVAGVEAILRGTPLQIASLQGNNVSSLKVK